jgi:hypothetical protein
VGRGADADPHEQLDAYFDLLGSGWDAQVATLRSDPLEKA